MSKKIRNILLVSGHPAQVHNFRTVKSEFEKKGFNIFWMATEKDISKSLLDHYDIAYEILERPTKSLFSKVWILLKNNWNTWQYIRKNKIDLIVSRVSPFVSLGVWLAGKPHIGMSDTESSGIYDTIFSKLLDAFLTSTSFKRSLRKDQIRFKGNIELFYLHPNRFTPSRQIYKYLNLEKGQPYVIMRFVSWDAYHDTGLSGFTDKNKLRAVKEFSRYAKVFITSEKELPAELMPYRISIPPEMMHDALAHATLFFGESATMASESAVLGRPAIFLNENWFGSTDDEQEYGLLFSYKESEVDQLAAIEKGVELLERQDLEQEMKMNHEKFMSDKIDMTAFLVWFIENWPESKRIMQEDPGYQDRFR